MRSAASTASSTHRALAASPGRTRRDSSHRKSSAAASTSGTPIPRSSAHRRPRSSARIRSRPLSVTARSTTRSASTPWTTPNRAARSVTAPSGCATCSSASRAATRARAASAPPPHCPHRSSRRIVPHPRGRRRGPHRDRPGRAALRCWSGWTSRRPGRGPRRGSSSRSWSWSCSPACSPPCCSAVAPPGLRLTGTPDRCRPTATTTCPGSWSSPGVGRTVGRPRRRLAEPRRGPRRGVLPAPRHVGRSTPAAGRRPRGAGGDRTADRRSPSRSRRHGSRPAGTGPCRRVARPRGGRRCLRRPRPRRRAIRARASWPTSPSGPAATAAAPASSSAGWCSSSAPSGSPPRIRPWRCRGTAGGRWRTSGCRRSTA